MRLYIYKDYKDLYPQLSGSELTDALIIRALAEEGQDIRNISVYRDEQGKPFVDMACGPCVHVSCSHSHDTFACIVSDVNCGIDIQEKRKVNIVQIADRYFTTEEKQYVADYGMDGFFKIWTRREAYAKYTGVGLKQVMSDVSVLNRADVSFDDSVLDNDMYCSICY